MRPPRLTTSTFSQSTPPALPDLLQFFAISVRASSVASSSSSVAASLGREELGLHDDRSFTRSTCYGRCDC
jgi:hypothetical protein